MLPTPAIRFWSSSIALIGARQRLASACRCAPVNSGSNGSTPSRAAKNASSASWPSASSPVPKRRGSTNSSSPSPRSKVTRVCRGRSGGRSSSVPVIRRCSIRYTSSASSHTRYLPRRPSRSTLAALDRGGQLGRRQRQRPAGVVDHEALERPALDVRGEVAADRLDLGQLGHRAAEARRTGCGSSAAGRARGGSSEMPSVRRTARSVTLAPRCPGRSSSLNAS